MSQQRSSANERWNHAISIVEPQRKAEKYLLHSHVEEERFHALSSAAMVFRHCARRWKHTRKGSGSTVEGEVFCHHHEPEEDDRLAPEGCTPPRDPKSTCQPGWFYTSWCASFALRVMEAGSNNDNNNNNDDENTKRAPSEMPAPIGSAMSEIELSTTVRPSRRRDCHSAASPLSL